MARSSSSYRIPQQRWQIAPAQSDSALVLARLTQLHPMLAQVLINRGILTGEMAQTFLDPENQVLPSPLEEFPDLPIALEVLLRAIDTGQAIAICGDYDADGMTSTALLLRALRYLGAQVDYAIPSRMQEGYGINRRIIEEFHKEGVDIVLTVDNGISAYDPIVRARELGLIVIITDHHDVPEKIPPANAILNPKLIREASPFRGVAGVGVAYILAICLAQCLGKTQDLTTPLLELFTLGTIADLAPLTGVNRRWVRRGLKLLPKSKLPGIQALIQVAGLSNDKELKPEAIGFRLGPRINAIGRISDPQIIIQLLTTDDDGEALELAMKCEQVNQLRQRLCQLIEEEAIAWCEQSQVNVQQERVLVVVQPDWHHGVIGIVASRLVERYGVPVFIGTYEENDPNHIRGSARGIPEFNVFEALQACADLLDKFGGHRAAGGFSFSAANLEAVRSRLSQFAHTQLQPEHLKPLVKIDAQARLEDITLALYSQIDQLHPCGIENPDPVFWTPNVRIVEQKTLGQNQAHLKVTVLHETAALKAIAWRWGEYYPLPDYLDIAYRVRLNEWNGNKSVELELVGARPTSEPNVSVSPVSPNSIPIPSKRTQLVIPETMGSPSAIPGPDALVPNALVPNVQLDGSLIPFQYNTRNYSCQIVGAGALKELKIINSTGNILTIQPQQRRGFLGTTREEGQEIDISQPHYHNLIRAALDTLEQTIQSSRNSDQEWLTVNNQSIDEDIIDEQAINEQSVNEKPIEEERIDEPIVDELTVDEQHQILVTESIATNLLQEQNAEKIIATQITFTAALDADKIQSASTETILLLEDKTVSQEHIDTPPKSPRARSKNENLKRQLQDQLGDATWFCLTPASQKDLIAVYKDEQLLLSEAVDAASVNYASVAARLSLTVEREVGQPLFKALTQFLTTSGITTIANFALKSRKKYTLDMLPPLLSSQWQVFQPNDLNSPIMPAADDLYTWIVSEPVDEGDRQRFTEFLQQWDHPIAPWLTNHGEAVASSMAQIHQLRTIAVQAEGVLYGWHYQRLRSLILGDETQRGILRH